MTAKLYRIRVGWPDNVEVIAELQVFDDDGCAIRWKNANGEGFTSWYTYNSMAELLATHGNVDLSSYINTDEEQ
jgi:hypothetical protein